MKLKTLLFFTIIFSSNNIISQTLEETIKFIETKYPIYQSSTLKSNIKIDFYGNIEINNEIEGNSEISKTTFNINDVKLFQTIVKYDPEYLSARYILNIECNNQKNCINVTNILGISNVNGHTATDKFRGKIELAKILKALNHLKKITKKEPF